VAQVNVTQEVNHISRRALRRFGFSNGRGESTARSELQRHDFGSVYAQLLIENGPGGAAMITVATETNAYMRSMRAGQRDLATPVGTPVTGPGGNINPLGITGTLVDLASRSLFFDAMVAGLRLKLISLNVDTGATHLLR
jgi:hypothetical protein